MIDVYIGIDVACARGKRLPICFVQNDGNRIAPLDLPVQFRNVIPRGPGNTEVGNRTPFRKEASQLANAFIELSKELRWHIMCIAIDAPAAPAYANKRASELELRKEGMSSFTTPTENEWGRIKSECTQHLAYGNALSRIPNANKIWMLYGFEIFKQLKTSCFSNLIEVFPYSIVCAIDRSCPHKSSEEGYQRQLKAVAMHTGWKPLNLEKQLRCVSGSRHDRLDSFMAAWTASLPEGKRKAYGNPKDPNDAIWVPDISR